MSRYNIIRNLINREVLDVVEETDRRISDAGAHSVEDIRSLDRNVVAFSATMQRKNRELKSRLLNNFYLDHRLVRRTMKAKQIIQRLFESFCAEPRQLPGNTQTLLTERDLYRVVCDYVAGMTDRYAAQEYSRLFDVTEWM